METTGGRVERAVSCVLDVILNEVKNPAPIIWQGQAAGFFTPFRMTQEPKTD